MDTTSISFSERKDFHIKLNLKYFLLFCSPRPFIRALFHDSSIPTPDVRQAGIFIQQICKFYVDEDFYSTCLEMSGSYFSNSYCRQSLAEQSSLL